MRAPATPSPSLDTVQEAFEAVFAELDDGTGNAPGHRHQIVGVWDDDSSNGDLAGKACQWCADWTKARDALAALPTRDAALREENARLRRALLEIAAAGVLGGRMGVDDREAFALIEERARTAVVHPSTIEDAS